ncbi:Beta-galactosidase-1-like protein [Coemansia sp. RSA 2599]|nr:Beta-galactosidase-1-like protein [Coemansia sp. RSA 2598]KAJ1828999.1 Beta-galactosidase-1-like protein [Coemansia sp. RSA 2599]
MRHLPLALATALGCLGMWAGGVQGRIERQVPGDPYAVGYSARGLLIDGQPRVLTAGAIHYPRSTPDMWDSLMKKAKRGGLNTIDTYVFWNMHERTKGTYDFATDRANLPLFLETAKKNGLFVVLRIGPYVCAEWNYGGFPQWLRHEKDVVFQTYSKSFMREMKRFVGKVVDVARPHLPEAGGPIIAMQIENEYGDHQWWFGKDGERYADWCGETAASFNVSVPWIMCRQYHRVEGVIPTQNDFYCDQYLAKFHREYPDFPDMWTEMWPAWFQRWGEAAPHRPIEDIAYAVAKWYAHGGTYVAYYMYHGGTNFGRTSGPFIQTSYDYDGFLDEYGLENWPKYLHLAELHRHLLENADFITGNPVPRAKQLAENKNVQAHIYGDPNAEYLAFIVNANAQDHVEVEFDGLPLKLHRWSVTLVRRGANDLQPTVLYNTAHLSHAVRQAQKRPAGFKRISGHDSSILKTDTIKWRSIELPDPDEMPIVDDHPYEHINVTDDQTDYMWYHTTVKVPKACSASGSDRTLVLENAGDVMTVYFDQKFSDMKYGRQDRLATFAFELPKDAVSASSDTLDITIMSQTMGMAHNQRHMESYSRGLLGRVLLCGHDITKGKWYMKSGLEEAQDDAAPVAHGLSAIWHPYTAKSQKAASSSRGRMRWYAIELDAQALLDSDKESGASTDNDNDNDNDADENFPRYAIDMSSMTKGQLWINGHHLGRYWLRRAPERKNYKPCQVCDFGGWFWPDNVCRQRCGEYSQQYYHLPRSYLQLPSEQSPSARNFLYVLEEVSGDPAEITVARRVSVAPPVHEQPEHGTRPAILSLVIHVCIFAAVAGFAGLLVSAYRKYRARQGYEPIAEQEQQGQGPEPAPAAASE